MTSMWDTDKLSIADLVSQVRSSELALPQFQRNSVWSRADWIPFLASVLRNRPTGTLLLLEVGQGEPDFEARPLERAPALKPASLEWLLLDGQQRSTTIYNAFENGFGGAKGGTREVVLNVKAALTRGELQEDDLDVVSSGKVLSVAEMAKEGKLSLRTLLAEGQFEAWSYGYAEAHLGPPVETIGDLVRDMDASIPGLRSLATYSFPVLKVHDDTPLEVVVDIFEGMNRRGQRLNQFDLMVARLYRELANGSRYDLRQEWSTALESSDRLQLVGVSEDDGMLPLQLIAMQVSRLPPDARPKAIKGLSNRDVLELPAEQVIGDPNMKPAIKGLNLTTAVKALEMAADFLYSKCGVMCSQLLPQQSMLIPIADQFLRPASRRLTEHQLKLWFFAAGLSISYYGSVNSYAERDCKDLARWADDGDKGRPTVVAGFDRGFASKLNLQQEMNREGSILGASLMALLVSSGVQDWRPGMLQLASLNEDAQLHHVVPHLRLKKLGIAKDALRPIAGLTPISASQNKSFRDKDPGQVVTDLGKSAGAILQSHQMDQKLLVAAPGSAIAWAAFLKDREARLRKFVVAQLGL